MSDSANNAPISGLLRTVTAIEAIVLLISGAGLFFLPGLMQQYWPWSLAPFNTRFLGAVYLGALVAVVLLVVVGRQSPARVVVPMIFVFTLIVLLISLAYLARFDGPRPVVALWFVLYAGLPANSAYHLWRTRGFSPADPWSLPVSWRVVLLAEAVIFGLYGLGLLAAPDVFSSFWPWTIDAFHGRMYSVAFITPAVGAAVLVQRAAQPDLPALGLPQAVLGALAILGLVIVDQSAGRVSWSAAGTWLWLGTFTVLVAIGLALGWQAKGGEQL